MKMDEKQADSAVGTPRRKRPNAQIPTMLMLAAMMYPEGSKELEPPPARSKANPWDGVQLTKTERHGKTPEEIQAARRAKYEAGL
jgi:hypothetical protein